MVIKAKYAVLVLVLAAQHLPLKAEENRGLTELKTLEVTSEVYDESQLKARHPKERISYMSLDECIQSAILKNPIKLKLQAPLLEKACFKVIKIKVSFFVSLIKISLAC